MDNFINSGQVTGKPSGKKGAKLIFLETIFIGQMTEGRQKTRKAALNSLKNLNVFNKERTPSFTRILKNWTNESFVDTGQ